MAGVVPEGAAAVCVTLKGSPATVSVPARAAPVARGRDAVGDGSALVAGAARVHPQPCGVALSGPPAPAGGADAEGAGAGRLVERTLDRREGEAAPEALAVLVRGEERLDHLGLDEIAVELPRSVMLLGTQAGPDAVLGGHEGAAW